MQCGRIIILQTDSDIKTKIKTFVKQFFNLKCDLCSKWIDNTNIFNSVLHVSTFQMNSTWLLAAVGKTSNLCVQYAISLCLAILALQRSALKHVKNLSKEIIARHRAG